MSVLYAPAPETPRYLPYNGEGPIAGLSAGLPDGRPKIHVTYVPDKGENFPGMQGQDHIRTLAAVGDAATLEAIAYDNKTPDAKAALVRAGTSDREQSAAVGTQPATQTLLWDGMRTSAQHALDELKQEESPAHRAPTPTNDSPIERPVPGRHRPENLNVRPHGSNRRGPTTHRRLGILSILRRPKHAASPKS